MKTFITALLLWTACSTAWAAPQDTFTLQSRREPGSTDWVVVLLEVGGETRFAENGKPQTEKMNVICNLEYFEKTVQTPTKIGDLCRSVRDYRKASATVRVGDSEFKPALQPQHQRIVAEAASKTTLLFSPEANLTRDELDAIDIQACSLLVDRLLPEKPVAVGDTWPVSNDLMAAMLGLDEVAKSNVKITLKEVKDESPRAVARFEFSGLVEGAVYGVSTEINVKGKFRFDMKNGRVDWLGMLIKERREPSFITDGVDVVSRLQMTIAKAQEPESLSDDALAKLSLQPTAERTSLILESPDGRWRCNHDRRWYVHHQRPNSSVTVLRYLDRGELTAQCNLSSLPKHSPEKPVSLEEFQEDVRKALDQSFGEFIDAGQYENPSGYRVYRVTAEGTSAEIPMRWIYYLVADAQGNRASFTFAVEQKFVDRFADADKSLVDSLLLSDKQEDSDGPKQ